jgi:hypothetical protein
MTNTKKIVATILSTCVLGAGAWFLHYNQTLSLSQSALYGHLTPAEITKLTAHATSADLDSVRMLVLHYGSREQARRNDRTPWELHEQERWSLVLLNQGTEPSDQTLALNSLEQLKGCDLLSEPYAKNKAIPENSDASTYLTDLAKRCTTPPTK